MKFKLQFLAIALAGSICSYSQTNTFPSSGNAGIGTTSPAFPLTLNTTSTNEGVRIGGGTYYLDIMANMSGGGYHPLVGVNTVGIIYKGGSENNSNSLVIAPWANTIGGGIHMDQYGRVGIGTYGGGNVLNLKGDNNPLNDIGSWENYQLRIAHNYNSTNAVASGIAFGGNNSDGSPSASIYHEQQGQPSYGDLIFATKANGGSMSEKLRIGANGNIGIGTEFPTKKLEIQAGTSTSGVNDFAVKLKGLYSAGDWTGIGFGATHSDNYAKAGIVFKAQEGNALTGDLMFLNNGAANSDNATTADVKMLIKSSGNVGIGTSSPASLLHVNGEISAWAESDNLIIKNSTGTQLTGRVGRDPSGSLCITSDLVDLNLATGGSAGHINIRTSNANKHILMSPTGNVGIGTNNPQSKLSVNGTITTTKLKVTQTGWADYVFENEYKLPTLQEVEVFIKKHKHLPGIVSAAEVEKEGIDVGDNQAALLKKIEELTLYVIEMNKQLEKQQKRIAELERK